jgi:enterochelin esterase family protein
LDYKYVANSNWILDPRNPNTVSGGFGPNSELAMPEYIQPWEIIDRPNVPKGQLSTHSIQSNILNATYQVQIYLPPAYDPSSNYPTAYFHDGQEYISLASANHIIDNLIDSNKIEPIIGVFVRPNNRNDEYAFQLKSAYKDFFTTELVPWVDSLYATRQDSSQRATIGASFGGNISAFIAFSRPDLFYKHGQHSGAWWPNNYETLQLVASDAVHWDLQMASVWGSFEGGLTNMWGFLSDSMTFYQYPNKYFQEYPEGHSWGLWRATLDEILIQLFPLTTNIGFDEFDNIAKQIFKPFPNPARTNIQLRSEDIFEGDISYSITNLNGQIIISGKWPDQGLNVQNLASGLYLLHLKTSETNEYHRLLID